MWQILGLWELGEKLESSGPLQSLPIARRIPKTSACCRLRPGGLGPLGKGVGPQSHVAHLHKTCTISIFITSVHRP